MLQLTIMEKVFLVWSDSTLHFCSQLSKCDDLPSHLEWNPRTSLWPISIFVISLCLSLNLISYHPPPPSASWWSLNTPNISLCTWLMWQCQVYTSLKLIVCSIPSFRFLFRYYLHREKFLTTLAKIAYSVFLCLLHLLFPHNKSYYINHKIYIYSPVAM